MGLLKLTGGLMLVTLFSIALITFAVNFADDNETDVNLADDPNMSRFQASEDSQIDEFYANASVSLTAMQESTIDTQTDTTEGGTQHKVTVGTSLEMASRVLRLVYEKVFGTSSGFGVFFTALIAFLFFAIGALVIKAWKGNP